MEFFSSSTSSFGPRFSSESFKNFSHISPAVRKHLKLVYLTLCCALASSAIGAYSHILLNIGGILTTIACFVCIGLLFAAPVNQERKRLSLLMGTAFFQGASIGPLIQIAVDFDPRILVSAFVGTALAFGCFSAAAIIAKRREFLYLGGFLSSSLSILLWLQFASSIFRFSSYTFTFELYFGLLTFIGYMIFDTQDIIERAHNGDHDYVKHALTLFTDFIAVLVRIIIIMLKNSSDNEEKKRKKRS